MKNSSTKDVWGDIVLSESSHTLEVIFFTLSSVLAFLTNVMMIVAYSVAAKRTKITTLCLNLCVVNLIEVVPVLLNGQGDTWLMTNDVCFTVLTVETFWWVLSLGSTAALVFECFVRTVRRLKNKASRNTEILDVRFIVLLLWTSAAVLSFITWLLLNKSEKPMCVAYQHYRFELYLLFLVFIVLCPMFSLLLMELYLYKHTQHSVDTKEEIDAACVPIDNRNNRCAFHSTHVLVTCWFPYVIYVVYLMSAKIDVIFFNQTAYKMLKTFYFMRSLSCTLQALVVIGFECCIKRAVRKGYKAFLSEVLGEETKPKSKKRKRATKIDYVQEVPSSRLEQKIQQRKKTITPSNIQLHHDSPDDITEVVDTHKKANKSQGNNSRSTSSDNKVNFTTSLYALDQDLPHVVSN